MKQIMTIGMMTIMMIMGTTAGFATTTTKGNPHMSNRLEIAIMQSNSKATPGCNCKACKQIRKKEAKMAKEMARHHRNNRNCQCPTCRHQQNHPQPGHGIYQPQPNNKPMRK